MSKFFTRGGDDGYTGLIGEGRIAKDHTIAEAVGTIDEASAALGLARSLSESEESREVILSIKRDLYHVMAEVATTPENASRFRKIDGERITWLESKIDNLAETVHSPGDFIVPGDSKAGAAMSLARAIVRRSERRIAALLHEGLLENIDLLRYLNRLSSLCFVLELYENQSAGKEHPTLARVD